MTEQLLSRLLTTMHLSQSGRLEMIPHFWFKDYFVQHLSMHQKMYVCQKEKNIDCAVQETAVTQSD
jgi:hypothetical protein